MAVPSQRRRGLCNIVVVKIIWVGKLGVKEIPPLLSVKKSNGNRKGWNVYVGLWRIRFDFVGRKNDLRFPCSTPQTQKMLLSHATETHLT